MHHMYPINGSCQHIRIYISTEGPTDPKNYGPVKGRGLTIWVSRYRLTQVVKTWPLIGPQFLGSWGRLLDG